jgi:SAM-dependent methyltransferase
MSAQQHDEDLWLAARACMFPASSFAAGPAEVAAIVSLAATPRGADVLDLACGPGRHTLPLARAGYRVVAVDRTASYLDELRTALEAEGERRDRPLMAELVHTDMRLFCRPQAFDLALCLYHSLGCFEDPADDCRVLDNLLASLRPRGALVVQLVGAEALARDFEPHSETLLDDETTLIQERRPSEDWTWMEVRWTFVRDGEEREFDLSHRIYSGQTLRAALVDAGFGSVALFGGYDGRPYDSDSENLVALARVT